MDTRTATAELGWTANPPSGVSATCPADPYAISWGSHYLS